MPCSAQKASKGEMVIAIDEPFVMNGGDPHTAQGTAVVNLGYQLYDGLVRRNPDGRYVPALAKSWEVAKDGMSIKFTLNERAKFHNGEPVTAKDVKFSFERAMRPELKYLRGASLDRNIDRIEVMDDHHLTFYFKSPFPGFFEWAGHSTESFPRPMLKKWAMRSLRNIRSGQVLSGGSIISRMSLLRLKPFRTITGRSHQ